MSEALERARAKYEGEKRKTKPVSFNVDTESDLLAHIDNLPTSFSVWVKAKLRDDMAKTAKRLE